VNLNFSIKRDPQGILFTVLHETGRIEYYVSYIDAIVINKSFSLIEPWLEHISTAFKVPLKTVLCVFADFLETVVNSQKMKKA
jgi:hypothetical protein